MKIEDITKFSKNSKNIDSVNIGIFADESTIDYLLFFSNLLDDTFSYYILNEQAINELNKSNVRFKAFVIGENLNPKAAESLFNHSKEHDVKVIYAPKDDSQKDVIKKSDVVIVNNFKLKDSLTKLNPNIVVVPHNLNEQYELIKDSGLFDSENYISRYHWGSDDNFDPIMHYLTLGIYENCNPFKDFDLNDFLKAYPKIKDYNIDPFSYYVILNQLFRFNGYYPWEDIFKQPSLSRLVLWDINNPIVSEINRYLQNEYENDFNFEIVENEDKLLFVQQNRFSSFKYDYLIDTFSKTDLMIKNRNTGKRILKKIKDFEVELTADDLAGIGICGIYDIHVQTSTLNKDFNFRVKFNNQNSKKILLDKTNCRIFWAYETIDHHLAFKYQEANFTVREIDVVKENEQLFLNGELTLLDDFDFESVEAVMFLNQNDVDRQYIPCDYEKYGDTIQFTGKIDFEYFSFDLGKNFKIDMHLKDSEGIIVGSRTLKEYYMDDLKDNLRGHVKKTVFFESFHAKFYSGQPKYIYEKMLELGYGETYDYVWAYNGEEEIPGSPMIIQRRSKNYDEILGASDFWITNISFPILKPREDTIYVQTTHGTPYKRMGSDIENENENVTKGRVLIESDTWNYLLSPNDFCKEVFARAFEYDGTIINKGYPANDIFYEDTTLKEQEIKEKLNLDPNKKIILYCPTFRDYEVDENNQKRFSHVIDLNYLYENIGEEYIIIMRLHYSIAKHLVLSEEMQKSIIDLSDYDDIADLYLITDILISDYSSAFIDFAHSKKPILFFIPDFEEYSSFRGLYSEIGDNLPGPEIFTDEELVNCIINIDEVERQYAKKYDAFYEMFCSLGHGTASKDVIDIIFGDDNDE